MHGRDIDIDLLIDSIDINVLVAGVMRRRQESMGSLLALLDLMLLTSANYSEKEKFILANLLYDKASLIERPN
jgi:hypothetical protein